MLFSLPIVSLKAQTLVFSDDFESGNLSKWAYCGTNGNSVTSTKSHRGTRSLKSNLEEFAPCHTPSFPGKGRKTYISFWVNWGTVYSCYNHWWRLWTSDSSQLDFHTSFTPCRSAPANLIIPFLFKGYEIAFSVPNPFWNAADDKWHRLEMLIYLNAPGAQDGMFKLWIDGQLRADSATTPPWSGNPKILRGSNTTDFQRFDIISNFDVETYNQLNGTHWAYIDDVEWWTDCPASGASCSPSTTTTTTTSTSSTTIIPILPPGPARNLRPM